MVDRNEEYKYKGTKVDKEKKLFPDIDGWSIDKLQQIMGMLLRLKSDEYVSGTDQEKRKVLTELILQAIHADLLNKAKETDEALKFEFPSREGKIVLSILSYMKTMEDEIIRWVENEYQKDKESDDE